MFRALLILLIGSVVSACLLTPLVYSLLHSLAGEALWPFSRVYDRVIMLTAALFLYLQRREFSLSELRSYFCVQSLRYCCALFAGGCLLSSLSGALVLPAVLSAGELIWTPRAAEFYAWKLLKTIPVAILISVLEESFFRILLFKKLRENLPIVFAAFLCSACYAVVHFIKPDKSYVYEGFSLGAGFDYLYRVMISLFDWQVLPPFFGFFLIGVVLCYVVYKTNALYLCIGLHTGWVLIEKMTKHSVSFAPEVVSSSKIGGRYFLVSQPMVWFSILIAAVVIAAAIRYLNLESSRGREGANSTC